MSKLIYKYLLGKLTDAEREKLESWISEGRENLLEFENLVTFWKFDKPEIKQMEDQSWTELRDRIRLEPKAEKRNVYFGYLLKAAALVTLLLASIFAFQYLNTDPVSEKVAPQLVERVTQKGQKITFKLPDGTKVKLNCKSKLLSPAIFPENKREVVLEGEGFFEVKKDKQRPFIVKTGKISTTALGTSFNINSYPGEDNIVVSLMTGKVKVEINGQSSETVDNFLLPDENMSYSKSNNELIKNLYDPADAALWLEGVLKFDECTVEEIVEKLENWYGVAIKLKNEPNPTLRFDGMFKNQTLDNVLTGIGFTLGFTHKINNKDVQLIFN